MEEEEEEGVKIREWARRMRAGPQKINTTELLCRAFREEYKEGMDGVVIPRRTGKILVSCVLNHYLKEQYGTEYGIIYGREQDAHIYEETMRSVESILSRRGS